MKNTRLLCFAISLLLSAPVQLISQQIEQPQVVVSTSQLALLCAQLQEVAAAAGFALPEALTSLINGSWNPEDAQQQFEAAAAALEQLASHELAESSAALVADLKLVLEQTFADLVAYQDEDQQEPTSKKAKEVFCNVFIKNLLNVCGNLFVNGKVTINPLNRATGTLVLEVNGDARIHGTLTVNDLIVVNAETDGDAEFANLIVNDTVTVESFNAGVIQSDANGLLFSSTNITEAEQLSLPQTTSNTSGVININGAPVLHAYNVPSNIFVGSNAGNFTTSGTGLTALGGSSLNSNTTGANNTAVGFNALFDNIGGAANTAVGSTSLRENPSGNSNTAVGFLSLNGNAAFSNSTAIGAEAASVAIGDRITAVGYQAVLSSEASDTTAVGFQALRNNVLGTENTALGSNALRSLTIRNGNTAVGFNALTNLTGGEFSTAVGARSLQSNIAGTRNTALGYSALALNDQGSDNVGVGTEALGRQVSGANNVGVGYRAGYNYTGVESNNIVIGNTGTAAESNTIRIGTLGTQTANFQAGIFGATTGVADAIAVLVDSAGQLGTISSSIRFKENIKSLDTELTQKMMQLRPVEYNYIADEQKLQDWGLIAEEVVEILPRLVVMDKDGQPLTVRYHVLPAMLLHMIQQQNKRLEDQQQQIDQLRAELAAAA